MSEGRKPINEGYVPKKIDRGYKPAKTTSDPKPQGGYIPTSSGDNPINEPKPPGNE